MLPFFYGSASGKRIVVGSGTISLGERGYVGLADTLDLASNDLNGVQMGILRLMPMGRNADRDAKCYGDLDGGMPILGLRQRLQSMCHLTTHKSLTFI